MKVITAKSIVTANGHYCGNRWNDGDGKNLDRALQLRDGKSFSNTVIRVSVSISIFMGLEANPKKIQDLYLTIDLQLVIIINLRCLFIIKE